MLAILIDIVHRRSLIFSLLSFTLLRLRLTLDPILFLLAKDGCLLLSFWNDDMQILFFLPLFFGIFLSRHLSLLRCHWDFNLRGIMLPNYLLSLVFRLLDRLVKQREGIMRTTIHALVIFYHLVNRLLQNLQLILTVLIFFLGELIPHNEDELL